MVNFRDKKILIPLGIIVVSLILYSISIFYADSGEEDDGKVKDCKDSYAYEYAYKQNSPDSPELGFVYAGVGTLVVFLLIWLPVPVYLIVKGKPDRKKVNAKRILGIWLIVAPLGLTFLWFFSLVAAFFHPAGIFLTMIVLLITIIAIFVGAGIGITYAIKKKVCLALIPLIGLPFVLLFFILALVIAVFSPSITSFSTSSDFSYGGNVDRLGFAVGGAKDADNFRENVENCFLPLPTDITYEGLYYDYFFDTGETQTCEKLFCPSYSYALSKDPFSGEDEHYLQVGLNSGIKESDFERKKLNLVIVLDVSGSMSSAFNRYYYDGFGNRKTTEADEDAGRSKMEIASKAVVGMLDHLNEEDRFGIFLFDNEGYPGRPMKEVGNTDMDSVKDYVLQLKPGGGTNFEAGYRGGTKLFAEFLEADSDEYENRIIFLTDAMPNTGSIREEGLLGLTKRNADNGIHTTFIGIGVDFNTELIETITKVRGANYYSVHSAKQFKTRMDDEFEYMVTPLVFNLLLKLDSPGFEIEKVYGSPEANEATGEIMKVNTLFPSKREEGETKGGTIVLKLRKTGSDQSLELTTTYKDRSGNPGMDKVSVNLPSATSDHYDNGGIRKGILLARYVNLMKNWMDYERENYQSEEAVPPVMTHRTGIIIPPDPETVQLSPWERSSIPLLVSAEYRELISEFNDYFKKETEAIGDDSLSREVEIMEKLAG